MGSDTKGKAARRNQPANALPLGSRWLSATCDRRSSDEAAPLLHDPAALSRGLDIDCFWAMTLVHSSKARHSNPMECAGVRSCAAFVPMRAA
jgi:hypothetical protein